MVRVPVLAVVKPLLLAVVVEPVPGVAPALAGLIDLIVWRASVTSSLEVVAGWLLAATAAGAPIAARPEQVSATIPAKPSTLLDMAASPLVTFCYAYAPG